MFDLKNRCEDMVGERLRVGEDKDYGIVTSFYLIDDGDCKRYIFVTDKDIKVDAGSFFRALANKNRNAHMPDGADYAARLAQPRKKVRSMRYVPSANMRNIATNIDYRGTNKKGGN